MKSIEARKLVKEILAPLSIPVKFRGEVLPPSGSHIVVDIILETPLTTWDTEEAGAYVSLQIGFWAIQPTSNASDIYDQANPLLAANGFFRNSTRFLSEDRWVGIQVDYEYF